MADKILAPAPDLFKSNEYIKILQVKKQMTLNQQKIFDAVLSTVQEMNKRGEVEELVREGDLELDYDLFYSHMLKGSRIKKINRKDLEQAMTDLVSISFSWSNEEEIGAFVLFQKGVIDFKKRKVKITFGKDFRTENMLPSANYTALSYEYLNKFKSQYSRLLYQYFKMLIGKDLNNPFRTNIELDIDFMHKLFGITEETHKEYINSTGSFIKRCIKPAEREINLHTELKVTFEPIKRGRFIQRIKFDFSPKENCVIDIEIDQSSIDKSKTNSLFDFKTFKDFKQYVVKTYSGKELGNNIPEYLPETIIGLSDTGFLTNMKTGAVMNSVDSHKVWDYFFKNQEKVGIIYIISNLLKAKKYIGRFLTTQSTNALGGVEHITIVITEILEEDNKFRIMMRNKLDFHNENPIKSTALYTLEEIQNIPYIDE